MVISLTRSTTCSLRASFALSLLIITCLLALNARVFHATIQIDKICNSSYISVCNVLYLFFFQALYNAIKMASANLHLMLKRFQDSTSSRSIPTVSQQKRSTISRDSMSTQRLSSKIESSTRTIISYTRSPSSATRSSKVTSARSVLRVLFE